MAAKAKAPILVGILAIAIAVVASVLVYNYLKEQEEKAKKAVATEGIVVAKEQISVGSTIKSNLIETAEWPTASLPQGAFTSKEALEGRRALERLVPGEPVVEAKLIPVEGFAGILTYKIPEGHRAMTVGVDQVAGVAGFITPGNMVDVVLTTTPPGASQSISKIVLQNIPILATGQIIEQSEDGKPVIVPTVTMDVTPDVAEKLAIASTQGRLQLVLRRAGETDIAKTSGATVTKVMSGVSTGIKAGTGTAGKRLVRAKPRVMTVKVEVWRNAKKTIETFKVEQL